MQHCNAFDVILAPIGSHSDCVRSGLRFKDYLAFLAGMRDYDARFGDSMLRADCQKLTTSICDDPRVGRDYVCQSLSLCFFPYIIPRVIICHKSPFPFRRDTESGIGGSRFGIILERIGQAHRLVEG